ncbi:hypothetical protein FQA39_LY14665 [Lamprigera yunnana]|nr:hypothetical protein FQA39_LY14665 [Lamprigera yunnana]
MWTGTEMYLDSESESDSEMETVILLYSMTKKRKRSVCMHDYLKQRNTHEEFLLLKELNNSRTKMYFRLNKETSVEIYTLIMNDITGRGSNAQQAIESDLKLAFTLRYSHNEITQDVFQTAKVAKLLTLFDKGKGTEYRNKTLDDINIDPNNEIAECDDNDGEPPASPIDNSISHDKDEGNVADDAVVSRKNKKSNRIRWIAEQKTLVSSHFKKHIKLKQAPKKNECEEFTHFRSSRFGGIKCMVGNKAQQHNGEQINQDDRYCTGEFGAPPPRSLSDDCQAREVGDQAYALEKNSGKGRQEASSEMENVINPFARRDSLTRTPPKAGTDMPREEMAKEDPSPKKVKKQKESTPEIQGTTKSNKTVHEHKRGLKIAAKQLHQDITSLDENFRLHVKNNDNQKPTTKTLQNTIGTQADIERPRGDKDTHETTGIGCTCKPITYIDSAWDSDQRKLAADRAWGEGMYKKTVVKRGNPLGEKGDITKITWVPKDDPNMNKSLQRMFKEKYPELLSITDDVQIIEKTTITTVGRNTTISAGKNTTAIMERETRICIGWDSCPIQEKIAFGHTGKEFI